MTPSLSLSSVHRGRTTRKAFWLLTTATWLFLFVALHLTTSWDEGWRVALVVLPAMASLGVLCVRRLHDLGQSGVWLSMLLAPVVGAAFLFLILAFKSGAKVANRWGGGGSAAAFQSGDHLTVK